MGRWRWSLLILGAILMASSARADPAISTVGSDEGVATWTFSNPANYTASSVNLGPSGASLEWLSLTHKDTSRTDFSLASDLTNIDLRASPGDVVLANTSQPGPVQNLTYQPDPASLADNALYAGDVNLNLGNYPQIYAGNTGGGTWTRSVLLFPTLPLPANATLVGARLELYLSDPGNGSATDLSVHRVTSPWTEFGSTWIRRDGVAAWNTTGGDFEPAAVDTVAGITNGNGWYGWNITSLVAAWWTRAIPNQGVMIRQVDDTVSLQGLKGFHSSDASNTNLRPRLQLAYTTPSSRGQLVSAAIDAGGLANWGALSWTATVPAGTSVRVRARTGNVTPVDGSWTPWSPPLPSSGTPIPGGPARYAQYALELFTPSSTSPRVADVAANYARYAESGTAVTAVFDPGSFVSWGLFTINATAPPGTSVTVAYSQDDGLSWLPLSDGENLTAALPRAVRIQVTQATVNTLLTPRVESASLRYRIGSGAGGPLNSALPWGIALVALLALAALLIVMRLRNAFEATGLLLIHTDGRVVANAGADGPWDEVAASAMLTLVHQFVRDSFQGPEGTGGELKSFKVDDKDVTIAKGSFLYLALVGKGTNPRDLPSRLVEFLSGLETTYGPRLEKWDGLRSSTGELGGELAWFLQKGYRTTLRPRAARYQA